MQEFHGYDDISNRIFRTCNKLLLKPLIEMLENSRSCYLDKWKRFHIIPVYKKNRKQLVKNYRPISLLLIFGKIFEIIIYFSNLGMSF